MLVGFAHVTHKQRFNVPFRLQFGATVKRFLHRFREKLPTIKSFILTELRKTRTNNRNKRLTTQTNITFPLCTHYSVQTHV